MDVGYKKHPYERQVGSDAGSHEQEVGVSVIDAIFIAPRFGWNCCFKRHFTRHCNSNGVGMGFYCSTWGLATSMGWRFSGRHEHCNQDDGPAGTLLRPWIGRRRWVAHGWVTIRLGCESPLFYSRLLALGEDLGKDWARPCACETRAHRLGTDVLVLNLQYMT